MSLFVGDACKLSSQVAEQDFLLDKCLHCEVMPGYIKIFQGYTHIFFKKVHFPIKY